MEQLECTLGINTYVQDCDVLAFAIKQGYAMYDCVDVSIFNERSLYETGGEYEQYFHYYAQWVKEWAVRAIEWING